MNRSRFIFTGVALTVAVGTGVVAVRAFSAKNATRASLVTLEQTQMKTAARLVALEAQIQASARRAESIEADNAQLSEALARARAAHVAKAAQAAASMTRQEVEARFREARALAEVGDPAEALRALLWCWDEGATRLSSGVATAQMSDVMSALGDLAAHYPPAADVLRERRDLLRQRVIAGPGGDDAVRDYAGVLGALNEENAMIDLLDQLPKGDRPRTTVAIYSGEQLVAAKRYDLAIEASDFTMMLASFEARRSGDPGANTALRDIEILTGVGDLAHARELAARVLASDNSREMRALVQQRAERAGYPDLLKPGSP